MECRTFDYQLTLFEDLERRFSLCTIVSPSPFSHLSAIERPDSGTANAFGKQPWLDYEFGNDRLTENY